MGNLREGFQVVGLPASLHDQLEPEGNSHTGLHETLERHTLASIL